MKVALSIVLAFLIVGCSSEAPKEEKVIETKKVEVLEEKSVMEKTTDKVVEVKDEVKEKVIEVKETVVDKVEDAKADLETKMTETQASVKETTTEVVDSIKSKVTDSVVAVKSKTVDADLLYNKCSGCHGGMGERAALGKSAVIRDWSSKQIEHSLLGYQKGTYGRTMKTMMQSQVKDLSAADIKALSDYISDK